MMKPVQSSSRQRMPEKGLVKTVSKPFFMLFAAMMLISSIASASHFRFGLITATRLSETSTTVTYRLNVSLSWRLTTAPTTNRFNITGPSGNPTFVNVPMSNVTDPSGGWTNSTGGTTVTLVKSATLTRITFTSCCKISTLANNRDRNWDVYTILNTNAPGSTPVSSMPAIINMPSGAPAASFTIPASDPDAGSTLTFGIPNLTSGNLAGQTEPSGFAVNATTGTVTLNTVGKTAGQLYNAMVTVTDNNNNQIMLDFIINIVGPSNPPVFDYTAGNTPANGTVFNIIVGQNLTFPIKATDPDAGSTVGFSVSGLTSAITTANFVSPSLPATGNPAVTNFSYTPLAGAIGTSTVLNFIATDNVGVQTTSSVTIKVVGEPAPTFISPTPSEGSIRSILTGVAHTDTIKAQSSLGSNVSIAFATTPSGMSHSPSIPTSGTNPGQTISSWTPAPSDFGVHNIAYTATIAATPTIFGIRTYKLIVNTLPVFTSTPVTTGSACAVYSYTLTATDANTPYGDTVSFHAHSLPSWLTLTNVSPGVAVLSGTPTHADAGSYHLHVSAEDLFGHSYDEVEQHINITISGDATGPTVTAPANITVNAASGTCASTVSIGTATATDNCGVSTIVNDHSSSVYNVGTTTVTWTATDINGNTGTASQTITVVDNQAPTITVSNVSVNNATGTCGASVTLSATASDNCSGVGTPTNDWAGGAFPVGTTTVNWTVTDAAGNTGTATQTVTVTDNQAPVITVSNVSVNNATGTCGASVTLSATASDNCSGVGTPANDWAGGAFPVGTTTVNWSVTDAAGNTGTATQTVTVTDNQAPTITVSNVSVNNATGTCGASVTLSATASDNCSGVGTPTNDWTGGAFPVGTTTVNWSVTDAAGNTGTATQTVTVTDNQAPVITVSNVSVNNATGTCGASVTLSATASDNCSGVGTPANDWAGGAFPVGTTTVNWSVTDAHGNSATATQTVTVTDNEAPNAVCQNKTVYLSDASAGSGSASISVSDINNGSTDNCGLGTLSLSATSFNCSNIGTNTVTLTVPDVHGNSSTCTATVTVVDDAAPHAICQNKTVYLSDVSTGGTASITVSDINNGSWDNCSLGTLSLSGTSFNCSNVGSNTVTLTVPDANGNSASCTATVTVTDNSAPHALCQNKTIYLSDASSGTGSASISVSDINDGSWDNCSLGTLSLSKTSFNCSDRGTNTVTLTVPDVNGNSATCTATVTVVDNSAPHASCQNYTLNLSGGTGTISNSNINNGSWDNCGIATMTVSPSTFNCSNAGSNTVTLTVTDAAGNSSSCTATVTVQYQPTCSISVAPSSSTFTGGIATNIYLGYGPQSATVTASASGGSGFTYSWSPSTRLSSSTSASPVFTPTASGTYTYTVTATNSNGCATKCTVSFCVVDAVDHGAKGGSKVILCHIPPGNPGNPQQLSISTSAVDAHLTGHTGDHLGPCYGGCGTGAKSENGAMMAEHSHEIRVYPNPTDGLINVEIPEEHISAEITITDVTGRVVAQRSVTENKGEVVQFNLGNVAKGIYLIKVTAGDEPNVTKVIVR